MKLLTAAEMVAAIEACMSDRRGDQTDPIVPPEPGWMSDADADYRADRDDERNDRTLWGGAA